MSEFVERRKEMEAEVVGDTTDDDNAPTNGDGKRKLVMGKNCDWQCPNALARAIARAGHWGKVVELFRQVGRLIQSALYFSPGGGKFA